MGVRTVRVLHLHWDFSIPKRAWYVCGPSPGRLTYSIIQIPHETSPAGQHVLVLLVLDCNGRRPRRAAELWKNGRPRAALCCWWWRRNGPAADTTTGATHHDAWAVVMSPVGSLVVPFGAPKEIHEISATLRFHRNSLSFYH